MKALSIESLKNKYTKIKGELTEKTRRCWAAVEAIELGYGGVAAVSRATGLTPRTIRHGIAEVNGCKNEAASGQQRKAGGGRKSLLQSQPKLLEAIKTLVEPYSSGDPERPLRWTCKSTYNLSHELKNQGFVISPNSVGSILKQQGYSPQSNRKRFEGKQHPDRNAQFEYIASAVEEFQKTGMSSNIC